jgi:N-acetylmuramoyl-L-alanine amidase
VKVTFKIVNLFICTILIMSMLFSLSASAESGATVDATSLNVREEPSLSAKRIGSLKMGEKINVLKVEKGWANIPFKGTKGWVSAEFLKMNAAPIADNKQSDSAVKKAKVTASSLNVRKGPGTHHPVTGSLKNGTIVTIQKSEGKWSTVTYGSLTGWVSNAYLLDYSAPEQTKPQTEQNEKENKVEKTDKWGTVIATYLNFRASAGLNAPIIGSLKYGTPVKILNESNGWSSVQTADGKKGWVSSNYVSIQNGDLPFEVKPNPVSSPPAMPPASILKKVVVMADGVNIRQGPSTSYLIVGRANQGDEYEYLESRNDWVRLKMANGQKAWIAGWLVAIQQKQLPSSKEADPSQAVNGLKGKRIVIDPGHGGYDPGAVGKAYGTSESELTLMTSRILATQLSEAGAIVVLTRSDNNYVPLNKRVEVSHYHFADAFISVHYNSALDERATGILSFYYSQKDIDLANRVHTGLIQAGTGLPGGNVRFGNFHVLRENKQPSVLIELGFLSNRSDEMTVRSNNFHTKAATGITNGLAAYFQ